MSASVRRKHNAKEKTKTVAAKTTVRAIKSERIARTGSATAQDEALHALLEEKPLKYIVQNLERAFGVPVNRHAHDPLDMLVQIILSQATSDVNSERAFRSLKEHFPMWDAVLRAEAEQVANAIRSGGLANQKAAVIKNLLAQINAEHGALDLNFLQQMTIENATRYLAGFRGLGPKTIACTLLFACRMETFPLDTHIFRVLRRVGLVAAKGTDKQAHELMNRVVPEGKFYSLHVNLIRLGRRVCRPREPLCERCPIVEYCDYGQALV